MAAKVGEERFVFETEWFDAQASLIRKYLFTYYSGDRTIEMYDLKNKKVFLKRMACPGVTSEELFIGSVITVYARQLKLVEYGDLFTRQRFESKRQRTFAMIKPDSYTNTGKIIDAIYQNGFVVSKLKMGKFSNESAGQFYGEHRGKPLIKINCI